jgi:hypothetical protein
MQVKRDGNGRQSRRGNNKGWQRYLHKRKRLGRRTKKRLRT